MSFPSFNEIKSFSNQKIAKQIINIEKDLFDLNLKKMTRQSFKPHQIKYERRKIAQLKTLLTRRLDLLEKKQTNALVKIIKQQNYKK